MVLEQSLAMQAKHLFLQWVKLMLPLWAAVYYHLRESVVRFHLLVARLSPLQYAARLTQSHP